MFDWAWILHLLAILGIVLMLITIPWVLLIKKDAMSAMAWCLLIFFLPVVGSIFFLIFGYQHVHLPLTRKRKHRQQYRQDQETRLVAALAQPETSEVEDGWNGLTRLALRFGAFPRTCGNRVKFYHEGRPLFDDILEAIRSARHHIHMEYFIFRADELGSSFLDLLEKKAREGVEVRLLYDAMGSRRLRRPQFQRVRDAGGKISVFLPVSLLRRRIQVNLRDHRKITVIDGRVAFTGGFNVGDEYVGRNPRFGFWRDTHMRIEGPAVAALQQVFLEGWDFAADEKLGGDAYFPPVAADGPCDVQVVPSGPDQEMKSIREVYFAAILKARRRLWIASPYFVPDAGLLDALCLAAYLGVDVRLLCQYHPDKWIPLFAARYYWSQVLDAGVKVYQYTLGMLHSKVVLVDGEWASVGTANLDNRSLHLNFEVNCLLYSPDAAAELEQAFRRDLEQSIRLDQEVFARRPMVGRVVENACRLLSPVL